MKKIFIALLCLSFGLKAQNFGFNADGFHPHTFAMMDFKSSSKGKLIPRIAFIRGQRRERQWHFDS